MISSCSANIARRVDRSGNAKPYAACSRSFQPAPNPSSTRPPETWSAVTTTFASSDGWRNVAGETIDPSRMRCVTPASAVSVAQASSEPRSSSRISDA